MKNSLPFLIAAFILMAAGCKLDKPDFSKNNFVSPSSDNLSASYQPSSTGTFWKYRVAGLTTDTSVATLNGTKQTFGGRVYDVADGVTNGQTTKVYFYHQDHVYRTRQIAGGITLDFFYLNDTTVVGHSWTVPANDSGTINGIGARIVGTVIERDITKVISGKTFTHVIHTQLDLQYDYPTTGFTSSGLYDYYIAQGIGIVEVDSNVLGFTGTSKIIDYSIK